MGNFMQKSVLFRISQALKVYILTIVKLIYINKIKINKNNLL